MNRKPKASTVSKDVGHDLKKHMNLKFPSEEEVNSVIGSASRANYNAIYVLLEWHRFLRPGVNEEERDLQSRIWQAYQESVE